VNTRTEKIVSPQFPLERSRRNVEFTVPAVRDYEVAVITR
jgi:hypothetical protein